MIRNYRGFKVVGLQRTGTNWISELIKKNFVIEEYDYGFWKHLTPLGTKENANLAHYSGKIEDLVLDETIFYIATSKTYKLWLQSLARSRQDFDVTHSTSNTELIYDSWFLWKDKVINKRNFYYHDYIEWLNKWEQKLEEIEQITGWQKRYNAFYNVTGIVNYSPNFNIENYADELHFRK